MIGKLWERFGRRKSDKETVPCFDSAEFDEVIRCVDYDKPLSDSDCSLEVHFEIIIGGYYVEYHWLNDWYGPTYLEVLYYLPGYDPGSYGPYDKVPEIKKKENIVAYLLADEHIALVKRDHAEQLRRNTEGYEITFIAVDDFDEEVLSVDPERELPDFLKGLIWVNDDFLYSEDMTIPFDFAAFQIIDTGVEYLNPKHFSVRQLISAIKKFQKDS